MEGVNVTRLLLRVTVVKSVHSERDRFKKTKKAIGVMRRRERRCSNRAPRKHRGVVHYTTSTSERLTMQFCGLISACITPAACTACRARARSIASLAYIVLPMMAVPWVWTKWCRLPRAQYSVSSKTESAVRLSSGEEEAERARRCEGWAASSESREVRVFVGDLTLTVADRRSGVS